MTKHVPKGNTGQIKFKLMKKVHDVCGNDWNKASQNVAEELSWKVQWPVYKNNMVVAVYLECKIFALMSNFYISTVTQRKQTPARGPNAALGQILTGAHGLIHKMNGI